jgi:hypothetical protein
VDPAEPAAVAQVLDLAGGVPQHDVVEQPHHDAPVGRGEQAGVGVGERLGQGVAGLPEPAAAERPQLVAGRPAQRHHDVELVGPRRSGALVHVASRRPAATAAGCG